MRDLEIRGAGELLGARQHGHIDSVGFDLYTRLLAQAINEARRKKARFEQAIGGCGNAAASGAASGGWLQGTPAPAADANQAPMRPPYSPKRPQQ
jgi:hypothetical protein